MARPKRADAVGNCFEQRFDRALGDLFPHAFRVRRNRLDRGVANLLEALSRRLEAGSNRRQAIGIAAFDEGRRQPGDDPIHLSLGHAIGQSRACERRLVPAEFEHLDASCCLRPSLGEKGDDFRPPEGRLRPAVGCRNNPDRRRDDKNESFHSRSLLMCFERERPFHFNNRVLSCSRM